jgi:hypothetical protein
VADTWQSASWQPADLNGYCIKNATDPPYGTYVSRKPTLGQGTWIGANQAFSFDWDGDGVDEIFMHGGYPQWDGYCAVFDPNRGVNGEWTTTASANNFSSGLNPTSASVCRKCLRQNMIRNFLLTTFLFSVLHDDSQQSELRK